MFGKQILAIREVQGAKHPEDKKILVEGKPLSIRDLVDMVRRMAANERRINRDKIARNNNFFFRNAILMAIDTNIPIDDIMRKTMVPDKQEDTRNFWPEL